MAEATKPTQDKEPAGIRAVYLPEGNESKMLQRVYTRYNSMKDSPDRKVAEKEWTKGRKQWEAMREDRGEDDWQSNHYVPITTSVVESALSEVIDQSPKPLILPRGSEDIPKVTVMSHIYDYTWEVADSDLEFEDIVHDAFTEGTGIGQEYFFSDIRKIKTTKKEGKNDEWEEENQIDYNDCYLECVKNDDFFVDENARGFRGPYAARDCVRRYIMHIDDFKAFFSGAVWNPLNNAQYVKPGGDTNYWEWYKPPQNIDQKDLVEVLWYWSVKPDDWLCIVANDVMVVMGPNPYKHKQLPFARAIDVKRTHRFYGKGEGALLESIQDELNVLRRMTIDRNHLDIDKMFIGSNRMNLSEDDLIARPHGFIPSDDPGSMKAVEYGDVPRSVELSMKHLEDDSTIVTGINPRAQALPTTGTATEAAILKESTLKRIRLKVRRFEREFLTRIARLRVSNILQYYPQAKLEKIVGEQATAEFKQQIADLTAKGITENDNVKMIGEDVYKKSYRQIRLENTDLQPDATGKIKESTTTGFTFFHAKPEYFMPSCGGYDIKFAAGSTLPISKPLLQTKSMELYDRLIQLALGVPGTYDPKKLGDMIIKINDMNPADLAADAPKQDGQEDPQVRLQLAVELANTENNLMMHGKEVPPTAYAPAAHTLLHVQFTSSPTFQNLPKNDPRIQHFIDHITGELAAQTERQNGSVGSPMDQGGQQNPPQQGLQGGGSPVPTAPAAAQNGGNKMLTDLLPSKIQGGGQVPQQ
jgi:hypothetical protein